VGKSFGAEMSVDREGKVRCVQILIYETDLSFPEAKELSAQVFKAVSQWKSDPLKMNGQSTPYITGAMFKVVKGRLVHIKAKALK
jgi:hypothetical protein